MRQSNHQPSRLAGKRRGFTLVEILIVIAIIAILSMILFPVFARVREGGRTTVCSSNMRQLAQAFQLYQVDAGSRYPAAGNFQAWGSPGTWVSGPDNQPIADLTSSKPIEEPANSGNYRSAFVEKGALYPYVKSANVYVCPSNQDGQLKKLSYSMNCAVSAINTMRIKEPASIILLVDEDKANDGYFYATDNTISGATGTSTDALSQTHNGGGNLVFCDGHAKFYPIKSFPLTSNSDATYGAEAKRLKWAGATATAPAKPGEPRFHDRAFGPMGSNDFRQTRSSDGAHTDTCAAVIP